MLYEWSVILTMSVWYEKKQINTTCVCLCAMGRTCAHLVQSSRYFIVFFVYMSTFSVKKNTPMIYISRVDVQSTPKECYLFYSYTIS